MHVRKGLQDSSQKQFDVGAFSMHRNYEAFKDPVFWAAMLTLLPMAISGAMLVWSQ